MNSFPLCFYFIYKIFTEYALFSSNYKLETVAHRAQLAQILTVSIRANKSINHVWDILVFSIIYYLLCGLF